MSEPKGRGEEGERERGEKEKGNKGKNIAFALYFSFTCLVTQPCLTLRDPTRLLCPWNSLGKNTGVGCHFLLHSPSQILVYFLCEI